MNSWVLYAIYSSSFSDSLAFEGGTALSKLYFPELWRFSEDLDFTATKPVPDLAAKLEAALAGIEAESGIGFEVRTRKVEDAIAVLVVHSATFPDSSMKGVPSSINPTWAILKTKRLTPDTIPL